MRTIKYGTPRDLADEMYSALRQATTKATHSILNELFEVMFFASLKTEETQPGYFDIVYLDPTKPDPRPPKRIMANRFTFVPFESPIKFTVTNLLKLMNASDPRTSSLVVYPDSESKLYIWGLVDQGNRVYEYFNLESTSCPQRPGFFQATVVGPGHLISWKNNKKVAELRVDTLVTKDVDVIADGPIRDRLNPGIHKHLQAVKMEVGEELFAYRGFWPSSLSDNWLRTLCRLLLRIQRYHHGGAVLISNNTSPLDLNIKYQLHYERLREALRRMGKCQIELCLASDQVIELVERNDDTVPMDWYLDETVLSNELQDLDQELASSIWFTSLLSRVDGLILLDEELVVKGFGVEIMTREEPLKVRLAQSRFANKNSRSRSLDYKHFGTRHRSMMRYCYKFPDCVGFVVSQDGDVRAMTRVGPNLILWDNIKLQRPEFMRRPHLRSSAD